MPTYEYRCPEGHEFELFQRMSDEPGAECPTCGKPAERQLSAGAGFLFKGEGFYITDYRSEDYKKKAKAESGGDGAKAAGAGETAKASGSGETAKAGGSGEAKAGSGSGDVSTPAKD